MIRQIKEHLGTGGQFLVFYSCKHKAGEDHSPFKNKLGVALAKNGFTFETWDFTESERLIWEKTIRVADELIAQFKVATRRNNVTSPLPCDLRITPRTTPYPHFRHNRDRCPFSLRCRTISPTVRPCFTNAKIATTVGYSLGSSIIAPL